VFITHVRLEDRIPFNPLQVIKHFLRIVTLSKLFEFWALYSFGLFLDLNNQVNTFFYFNRRMVYRGRGKKDPSALNQA